jgi:methyl-accepting chemotaxis protein
MYRLLTSLIAPFKYRQLQQPQMKKNGFSHIHKWLLIYLSAVLLTTMAVYLLIYTGVASALTTLGLEGAASGGVGQTSSSIVAGIKLRLLLYLGGGFMLLVICGGIWVGMTTRHIGRPVHTIATAMSKLVKGQLNETVAVETSDEFEQIGACINEVAANLQELLLYIWKQTGQCHDLLDHIHCNPDLRHDKRLTLESLGYLKQLSAAIDDLREMAKAYVFYDVSIEGTNTHAISEPGDGTPSNQLPIDYN